MDKVYFQIDKRGKQRLFVQTYVNGKRIRHATCIEHCTPERLRMYRSLFFRAYDEIENVERAVEVANDLVFNIALKHYTTFCNDVAAFNLKVVNIVKYG